MVIITGANGFVGQHLVPLALKYFNSKDILCLSYDKNATLEKLGLKMLEKIGLKNVLIDLVTKKGLKGLPKSPDVIIHMAAATDTAISNHSANDIGTRNLLGALGPLKPKTHFIYISTAAVMSGREDCSKPFDESSLPKSSNEYGRSKLRAEEFLKQQCRKDKFRLTIIRMNTIYGNDPRENKMFKLLKREILKNSFIARLNWPGLISLIHVDDAAYATLELAKKKPAAGKTETYILYAENLSLSNISRLMYEEMKLQYRPINLPEYFWKFCSSLRKYIPLFEKIIPLTFYNPFWRWGLIVDNVLWSESRKLFKVLPKWEPKKFEEKVEDVTK